jgi:hypothetical protein
MGFTAPKERTHLSADALFGLLRRLVANPPDHRRGDPDMTLRDALMSGVVMFSLTCPSLLTFAKQRAEGHLTTIYGIERPPWDSALREMLDPLSPESLRASCKGIFRQLQRGKALEAMVFFQGWYWLALDGTGYVSSQTIPGQSCLETHHRHGSITYAHPLLGAAIRHPDYRAVIPLRPEAIVKQDGRQKNDGERHAAKRFMATWRQAHPHLGFIVTEDGLSANAPPIETLQEDGGHSLLGVQEGDQAYWCEQVRAAAEAGRGSYEERHDRAAKSEHRFRFINDLPLNDSRSDVRVNVIEDWEVRAEHGQHLSGVTDVRVHTDNVYKLMRGGRARWKIEHETCNTLKPQGDHFDHNDGHGEPHRSVVLATLRMLAFLVDQTQQLSGGLFRAVWHQRGSKSLLWERRRALFVDDALEAMRQLLEALFYGFKKSAPAFSVDSS